MSFRYDPVRLSVEPLETRETPATLVTGGTYDPTHILVSLDPSRETAALGAIAGSPLAAGVTSLGLGVYCIDLAPGTPVGVALPEFQDFEGVASAQPDFLVTVDAVPNDPGVSGMWNYSNPGGTSAKADADIDVPEAWNIAHGTGQTIVAVLDSGVDYTHSDLAANMWRNPGEIAGNGKDDDRNGFVDDVYGADFASNDGDPKDELGHGTHVAGTIGAVGNNGVGIAGVAWSTRIMALKFMDSQGNGYTSDAVRALDYAIAHGAKVVNASWGGGNYNAAMESAIARARAAGVIFVASAGNNGANNDNSPYYPASYITKSDNVVTVAATDRSDNLASFSNFGAKTVTLAAPGVSINSTRPGNRYVEMSGTSMAAPQVAGALAVLWDQHPTWTYQQILAQLRSSVDVLPSLTGKTQTGGRLNLAKLVGAPDSTPAPTSPSTPTPTTPTGAGPRIVTTDFSASKSGIFDRVVVSFDRAIDPATFSASDMTITGPGGTIGVSAILPVSGSGNTKFNVMFSKSQSTTGTYSITIGPDIRDTAGRAMDQNGNGIGGETGDRTTASATLGTNPNPAPSPSPTPSPTTPTGSGPTVVSAVFSASKSGIFDRVVVSFDRAIDPATFSASDMTITGPGGTIGVSAILPVSGSGNTKFNVMFSKSQSASGTYSIAIGPDIRDTAGRAMDQNGNGIGGETGDRTTASATLGTTVSTPAPSNRQTYTASIPTEIGDRRTTRLEIAVTDEFRISDLDVSLSIEHARTYDLSIRLVSPTGQIVNLFTRRSGTNLVGTIFDDSASVGIACGSGNFAGSYRPEQSLASLNGLSARGTWTVEIFDLADGVTGRVTGVSLSFAKSTTSGGNQRLAPLSVADLRGSSDAVKSAVQDGRPDSPATTGSTVQVSGSGTPAIGYAKHASRRK